MGPFVRPVGLRGRPGGGAAAPVSPAQRRPVLRQPQPDVPARGVEGLRQQQPDVGCLPTLDALPGQPRARVRQRPAGPELLPDPVHAPRQRSSGVRRSVVLVPGLQRPLRLAGRGRRDLPGRGGLRGRTGAAGAGTRDRQPADPAGQLALRARLQRRGADPLARANPGSRPAGPEIDWIIVQMHQDALSSSITGNGSDLGIRREWLPLFDRYEVDLVLCGHDHDYERSFPVRGYDPNAGWDNATGATVETLRPHPVTTVDNGSIDTSHGTVHLILGGGGTNAPLDEYGLDTADGQREAKIFTFPNRPELGNQPGRLRQGRGRCPRGRRLVRGARPVDRIRHRGLRPQPGAGRRDDDRRDLPARSWSRSGQSRIPVRPARPRPTTASSRRSPSFVRSTAEASAGGATAWRPLRGSGRRLAMTASYALVSSRMVTVSSAPSDVNVRGQPVVRSRAMAPVFWASNVAPNSPMP